jgi:hypothetical protein
MSRKNSAAAHVDTSQKTSGTGPTLEKAANVDTKVEPSTDTSLHR